MTTLRTVPVRALLAVACLAPSLQAHEHLAAGAASTQAGSPLLFTNQDEYGAETGNVFNLDQGTPDDPYDGYYYTGDVVFVALAATPERGGPEIGAAAIGSQIQVQLLSIEGPAGSSFGFWDTAQDGVDSTNLTWSVPVPYSGGTNLIPVSENDGSPKADPYGHLHGRLFSFTLPGLYKATWRFIDTSANGPGGGPIHTPSESFSLYYQADLTVARIAANGASVDVTFAAASNIPDSGIGPATRYTLETSTSLGAGADWQPVGDVIEGDDHLHTVTVPVKGATAFFRLVSE